MDITLRKASRLIGKELHSSDRFVCDAIDWLTRNERIQIGQSANEWCVMGPNWTRSDLSLPMVLAQAIFASFKDRVVS